MLMNVSVEDLEKANGGLIVTGSLFQPFIRVCDDKTGKVLDSVAEADWAEESAKKWNVSTEWITYQEYYDRYGRSVFSS